HLTSAIRGPLMVDGAGGEGSLVGLDLEPVMLPGETNIRATTGNVVSATGNTVTVRTSDVSGFGNLVNRTVEITTGPGTGQFRLITATVAADVNTILTLNAPWQTL